MNTLSLLSKDWMMRPEAYLDMAKRIHVAERSELSGKEDSFNPAQHYHVRKPLELDENGIAHIHIFGVLMNNPEPWMMRYEDITSYDQLSTELQNVRNGYAVQEVKGLLVHFDTPGGMVSGLSDAATLLHDVCAEMPVIGYTHELCCSAGYYLAASLGKGKLFSSRSAEVGNIGTILRYYDWTGYFEQWGIIPKAITNEGADLKSTFSLSGLTPEQKEFLQDRSNEMGADFQSQVTTNRTVSGEVFRAGWYNGQHAVDLGLSDFIGTKQDAYDTLLGML